MVTLIWLQKLEEFSQKVLNSEKPLETKSEESKASGKKDFVVDKLNSAHYSKGKVAASFTSTAIDVNTKQEAEVLDELAVKYKFVKKKGYARFVTNYGDLNLELYCQVSDE